MHVNFKSFGTGFVKIFSKYFSCDFYPSKCTLEMSRLEFSWSFAMSAGFTFNFLWSI